jgi:hypothetical protein
MRKKSIVIGARVSDELYNYVKQRAAMNNLPISWWLRTLINEYLKHGLANGIKF